MVPHVKCRVHGNWRWNYNTGGGQLMDWIGHHCDIAIGHRYPQVKINTAYSFGLDDQEFVVAFESDEPAAFLDLVMELRESQASRYTERETPIFTCVLMAPSDALHLALGLNAPDRDAERDLQQQVSLIAGG